VTETQLQALCDEWQQELGLSDWTIITKFARYHELEQDRAGNIEWNIERRGARIRILQPNDEAPDGLEVLPEHVLVHELLHIHFRHYAPDGVENTCFEQGLNAVASALVRLKRAAQPSPAGEMSDQEDATDWVAVDAEIAAWRARKEVLGCKCLDAWPRRCYRLLGREAEGACWCGCHKEPRAAEGKADEWNRIPGHPGVKIVTRLHERREHRR
jgi:hypothetical protein